MRVEVIKNDGLSHEYTVVIPAADMAARLDARLREMGAEVTLPGFRPGRVPLSVLRARLGASARGEVLEKAVNETSRAALAEQNVEPVATPRVTIDAFDEGQDLSYTMAVDCKPPIPEVDFSAITLPRFKVREESLRDNPAAKDFLRSLTQTWTEADRPAKAGDRATLDYKASVEGRDLPDAMAAGAGYSLPLDAAQAPAALVDAVTGMKAGEEASLSIPASADGPLLPGEALAFSGGEGKGPDDRKALRDALAGKDIVCVVSVTAVQTLVEGELTDEVAKSIGLDSVAALEERLLESSRREAEALVRARLKRELLDTLDERLDFPLPERLVDSEFDGIWRQYERAKADGHLEAADAALSEEDAKAQYRTIAVRRVKLALFLAHIAEAGGIKVTQDEVEQVVRSEIQRFPGSPDEYMKHYRENPQLGQQINMQILENKSVDFLLEKVSFDDAEIDLADLRDHDDDQPGADDGASDKAGDGASA